MQHAELSSNWKKLKQSLANDRVEVADNGSTLDARVKKRKSATATSPSNSKKQKPNASKTLNQMGAYISSFVSPSTTPASTNPQNKPAPPPNATPQANSATAQADVPTPEIGKYISLDCEMVGTTSPTPFSTPAHHQPLNQREPEYSILARASLVSYTSAAVYDAYVLPPSDVRITNYRTSYSGITAQHLDPANPQTRPKPFAQVQREVAALLHGRVLVGHALKNDLAVLGLSHPERDIRDTSRYAKFRQVAAVAGRNGKPGPGRTPSLRKLAAAELGWDIQRAGKEATETGGVGHDSVEDARAAMALFRKEKQGFDADALRKFGPSSRSNRRPAKIAVSEVIVEDGDIEDEDLVEETPPDGEETGDDEQDGESAQRTADSPKKKRKKKKKKSPKLKK